MAARPPPTPDVSHAASDAPDGRPAERGECSGADTNAMTATDRWAEASRRLWTRTACSRSSCHYASERPGTPQPGDLDEPCALCGAALGAVTVYRLSGIPPCGVDHLLTARQSRSDA